MIETLKPTFTYQRPGAGDVPLRTYDGCPFCRSAALHVGNDGAPAAPYYVGCRDCGARGPGGVHELAAIQAWGARERFQGLHFDLDRYVGQIEKRVDAVARDVVQYVPFSTPDGKHPYAVLDFLSIALFHFLGDATYNGQRRTSVRKP